MELPTFNEITDVTALVPGATAHANKPPVKEGIQMRGSGITQSGADDGQSPVGYYVDDIPFVDISTPVPPPIGTFDLQRIEVIRGPQGTAHGLDSTAGSIIMRTNPVDLENFGYKLRVGLADVKGVDDMGYTIGGVVNIPIAEDVFGMRISYLREDDVGYGWVAGQPDYDDPYAFTRDSGRIKLFWDVTDWMDLEFTHSQWNTDFNTLPGTQILSTLTGETIVKPVTTVMLLSLFPEGRLKNDFEIGWTTLLARFDLGFAELTSSTGWVDTPKKETNSEFTFDIGLGPQEAAVIFNQPAETFTQQFRLVSTTDSQWQWIAGLFYMDASSNSSGYNDIPDFFYREYISDPIDSETWAIFGELEYTFNDQWSLLGGLRYHDEERLYTADQAIWLPGDPLFGPYSFEMPTMQQEQTFDATSYRLALNWSPTETGLVYLTHSTAYRAPILLLPDAERQLEMAGIENPVSNFDTIELINSEIGTKWSLLQGRMQLEAAYVYGDWKDIPLWATLQIPPQPLSLAIGGTDAVVSTWELSLAWAVHDYFTLTYGGAFTDTDVKSIPTGDELVGFPPAVQVGGELFNYSPTTHNFGINYNQPIGGNWELFGSLNYVTRDRPDGINPFDLSATEYVPARDKFKNLGFNFGASKGPWTLTFGINNATDEDGMFYPGTADMINGYILQPRTYSLQFIYDRM
jgi:outer membrane receptor protein involved in Fe transport